MTIIKSKEEFIKRAILVHGNKYDYSLVVYTLCTVKVKIKCIKHDYIFEQEARVHLKGHGCPMCGNCKRLNKEDFLLKSNKVHNNKYDYSKSIINNITKKTIIICPVHGEFKQSPINHIKGHGCSKCGFKITGNSHKYNLEYQITKSNKIHNNFYNYENIKIYNTCDDKIIVNCPVHGDFSTTFYLHNIRFQGCPKCKRSKGELKIEEILIKYNIKYIPQYKFKDCKNIKPLPFDFYLPDHNMCIEFDGEQHYHPVKFLHVDQNRHNLIKIKDNIKTNYCIVNNIKLIRIPYYEKQKIEEILKPIFNK